MATFIWGFIFGCIGLGYLSYGKSQRSINAMLCGLGLVVFPYFVSGPILTLPVGGILMAIPWIWRS